jgi:hypothetical protein
MIFKKSRYVQVARLTDERQLNCTEKYQTAFSAVVPRTVQSWQQKLGGDEHTLFLIYIPTYIVIVLLC